MIRTISFFLFLCFSSTAYSQQATHTFHMKDGSVFKGEIIEKMSDGSYRVKTATGNELIFAADNIKEIIGSETENFETSQDVNLDDYGSKQAIGLSLFGPGTFGGHLRHRAADELFLDFGLHYSPVALYDDISEEFEFRSQAGVSVGINYFLERFFKERKNKVRANGLFLNASHSFGRFDNSSIAFGWASEYFKEGRYHNSFLLELGPAINIRHWVNDPLTFPYNIGENTEAFNVHLRLVWNFHLGSRG